MADAARDLGVYVCGGNLTRGPLNIAVSAHGEIEHQCLLRRSGGQAGQQLSVTVAWRGGGVSERVKCCRLTQRC